MVALGAADALTYADLLNLWNAFEDYELNTLAVSPDIMMELLKMEQFQNPLTGLNFQGTGKLASPLGAKLIRSSDVPAGAIVGLDKTCALEMVVASDVAVDYDRLIDRQLERAAVTTIAGFAKIFPDATKIMKVSPDRGSFASGCASARLWPAEASKGGEYGLQRYGMNCAPSPNWGRRMRNNGLGSVVPAEQKSRPGCATGSILIKWDRCCGGRREGWLFMNTV